MATAAATTPTSEMRSTTSYRSTHSSRSSVMERAREYTRKIDESARRAKSVERSAAAEQQMMRQQQQMQMASPRSQSAGRPRSSAVTPSHGQQQQQQSHFQQQQQQQQQHRQQQQSTARPQPMTPRSNATHNNNNNANGTPRGSARGSPSRRSRHSENQQQQQQGNQDNPVVSPELLVDALSGHEDGLLAIAEKLMEHYDGGYDVMGEAIIDAFADVQKLFQHVVEAAHMEGAAFEASRREQEIQDLRQQIADMGGGDFQPGAAVVPDTPNSASSGGPTRHDEFVDQDVKDCLTKVIRDGKPLRDQGKHMECFQLYEEACQSASALLPVDSDHRARLQLSIARAESMSPDRACAILRYAMDDVLRSGMRAGKVPLPDPSKRADVVLSKPKGHPSMNGSTGQPGVVQSSEEALNSLVEEMKDVIRAPIYDNTPIQDISQRFWSALGDAQKVQTHQKQQVEHHLGTLKGEFLLARAEWEEKLTTAQEQAELYKQKYSKLRGDGSDVNLPDSNSLRSLANAAVHNNGFRKNAAGNSNGNNVNTTSTTSDSFTYDFANNASTTRPPKQSRGVESVASLGNSMAQHARSLVGSFACSGINERTGSVLATELAEQKQWRDKKKQHFSNSPKRVDI